MTTREPVDEGGEAPCFAHLLDAPPVTEELLATLSEGVAYPGAVGRYRITVEGGAVHEINEHYLP